MDFKQIFEQFFLIDFLTYFQTDWIHKTKISNCPTLGIRNLMIIGFQAKRSVISHGKNK